MSEKQLCDLLGKFKFKILSAEIFSRLQEAQNGVLSCHPSFFFSLVFFSPLPLPWDELEGCGALFW